MFNLRITGTPTHVSSAVALALALLCLPAAAPAAALYGGLGGHSNGDSTNDGALGIVDPSTGIVSIVGHPAGVSRISGLAFGLDGTLYGATQGPGGFPPPPGPTGASNLIRIDPNTGALIASTLITDGINGLSIADLAVQPGTGLLYGIRSPQDQLGGQGNLYTINPATGLATFVGSTGDFFASIAFAPTGILYMSSADLDFVTDTIINMSLKTLNPANAGILSTVATNHFFGALGIRSDGTIFGGTGDAAQLFTINPATGGETLIGSTGRNFVGDLAFAPVPEPGSFLLALIGVLGLRLRRSRTLM
jgi:outer membrane protein assembly factor BamB